MCVLCVLLISFFTKDTPPKLPRGVASSLLPQITKTIVNRPVSVWQESDRIAQLEEALQSGNEAAAAVVVAKLDDCPLCQERIAAFLDDPTQDMAAKIALAEALMQSGGQTETKLLVNAILRARLREDDDLKDRMLQALADAHTLESAAALMVIVTGEADGQEFQQLPEELQYAIQKAIRLNPDAETTGWMLAENYFSQATPELAERLLNIRQPFMIALLAKQAYESGDIQKTKSLTSLFPVMGYYGTLNALAFLSDAGAIPLDEANALAHEWADNQNEFNQNHYAVYLSGETDANETQRALAAFALAASPDKTMARASLENALEIEMDPVVRGHLESALELLSGSNSGQEH